MARPFTIALASLYVVLATCWSAHLQRFVPSFLNSTFENAGFAQSWGMFSGVAPSKNDFERIEADVRFSSGKTFHWEFPVTRWSTPIGEARSERYANLAVSLLGSPYRLEFSRNLGAYAARQLSVQAGAGVRPTSVDLYYPPRDRAFYLLKNSVVPSVVPSEVRR